MNRKIDEFGVSLRKRFIKLINEAYQKDKGVVLTRKDLLCKFDRNDHNTLSVYIHKLQEDGVLVRFGRAKWKVANEIIDVETVRVKEDRNPKESNSPKILRPNKAPWEW